MKKIIKRLEYLLIMLTLPSLAFAQTVPGFTVTEFASFPNSPVGGLSIAPDLEGNIYSGTWPGIINKINPSGEVSLFANLSARLATRVNFDPISGGLFVSNCQSRFPNFPNDGIWKVSPSGTVSLFFFGVHCSRGYATDVSGTLYVSEHFGKDRVLKFSPEGNPSVYVAGLASPSEIAFGPGGKLYIANSDTNQILQVTPGEGIVSEFAAGLNYPSDLVFDKSGNLYVTNYLDGTISKISPEGTVSQFGSGFSQPFELAFDPSGNLFISDIMTMVIYKVHGVSPSIEPFSEFTIDKARVNLGDEAGQDEFEVEGHFALVDGGSIDPVNEDVTLTFGDFSEIIQDGFFVDTDEFGVPEGFQYNGPDGSMIRIVIGNNGQFKIKARDVDVGEIAFDNPVLFSLQIGNDIGTTEGTSGIQFDSKGEFKP